MISWYPWRPEESTRFPGTRIADGYELLCELWEPNSGCLQEQLVLLTIEPSLQPIKKKMKMIV